jgi:hypothetical protein
MGMHGDHAAAEVQGNLPDDAVRDVNGIHLMGIVEGVESQQQPAAMLPPRTSIFRLAGKSGFMFSFPKALPV